MKVPRSLKKLLLRLTMRIVGVLGMNLSRLLKRITRKMKRYFSVLLYVYEKRIKIFMKSLTLSLNIPKEFLEYS